jgi:hypothetical protein
LLPEQSGVHGEPARAVQRQGGLPKLVQALHVVPAAICQVRGWLYWEI